MRDAYTEVYGEEYLTKQSKAWVHATHNYFTQRNGEFLKKLKLLHIFCKQYFHFICPCVILNKSQ